MKPPITGCVSSTGNHLTELLIAEDYDVTCRECLRNDNLREIREINPEPALGHQKEESYLKKRFFYGPF